MQFKDGTGVYAFDGQYVGRVDRVVLNPKTKEVEEIVVRKGFLFTEDKVIQLSVIASTSENRITLRDDAGNLENLPPFTEIHYIPVEQDVWQDAAMISALYWYPSEPGYDYLPPYRTVREKNIPEDTIALKDGARVMSAEDHHVGHVIQVLTEPNGDRVISFLMSEGIFSNGKKLIPVNWIRDIQENEIHLNVGKAVLDKLRQYREAQPVSINNQ